MRFWKKRQKNVLSGQFEQFEHKNVQNTKDFLTVVRNKPWSCCRTLCRYFYNLHWPIEAIVLSLAQFWTSIGPDYCENLNSLWLKIKWNRNFLLDFDWTRNFLSLRVTWIQWQFKLIEHIHLIFRLFSIFHSSKQWSNDFFWISESNCIQWHWNFISNEYLCTKKSDSIEQLTSMCEYYGTTVSKRFRWFSRFMNTFVLFFKLFDWIANRNLVDLNRE